MSQLEAYMHISVSEYSDGSAVIRKVRRDRLSRRYVTEEVMQLELGTVTQMTAIEMCFMGAAEVLGRAIYGDGEVV